MASAGVRSPIHGQECFLQSMPPQQVQSQQDPSPKRALSPLVFTTGPSLPLQAPALQLPILSGHKAQRPFPALVSFRNGPGSTYHTLWPPTVQSRVKFTSVCVTQVGSSQFLGPSSFVIVMIMVSATL
jgi:hypothetical protein